MTFVFRINLENGQPSTCQVVCDCDYVPHAKQTPFIVLIDETDERFESVTIRWNDYEVVSCETTPTFTKSSKLVSVGVGQIDDLRWITLQFSRDIVGSEKKKIEIKTCGYDFEIVANVYFVNV